MCFISILQADSSPAANSGAGRRRRRQSDDASSSLRDARSSARSESDGEDLLGDDMLYVQIAALVCVCCPSRLSRVQARLRAARRAGPVRPSNAGR